MISKQNIFSFRFVSTKWFTFTYRASQQMALDVTFTMENKLVLPFSYCLWNILIFRRGNPKCTWNQAWKMFSLGKIKRHRLPGKEEFWWVFSSNLLLTCSELCLLSPFCFLTGAIGTRTSQQLNNWIKHWNQCLTPLFVVLWTIWSLYWSECFNEAR